MNQERFFENFMLGVTQGEITVEDRELNVAAVHKLASSAVHNISIVSRTLNHQVFDRVDIVEAFNKFIHRSRNSTVRILVFDSTNVIKHSHRLINLADRIPSRICLKQLSNEYIVYNESFITADGKGYLHNPLSDRYDGSVNFNDKTRCTELDKIFTDYWHRCEPIVDLRRVSI